MPCPRQSSPLHGAPPPTSGPCPSHTAPPDTDSSVGGNTIHLMTSETGHSYSSLSASITIQSNSFNHFTCSVAAVLFIYFFGYIAQLAGFFPTRIKLRPQQWKPRIQATKTPGNSPFQSVIFQILDLNLGPPPLFRSSPDTTQSATCTMAQRPQKQLPNPKHCLSDLWTQQSLIPLNIT